MDTERKVGQLDADVHEIYDLLRALKEDVDSLRRSGNEQWGMIRRQGVRLDMIEANVAQLKDDVQELRGNVGVLTGDLGTLKADVGELKGSVAQILELLQAREQTNGPD